MASLLETPSRILRRIEAVQDHDMPSLPSLPAFDDDDDSDFYSSTDGSQGAIPDKSELDLQNIPTPIHSTPAASTHHSSIARSLAHSGNSSATRFANSLARSSVARSSLGKSSIAHSRTSFHRPSVAMDSFDISSIPSLSGQVRLASDDEEEVEESKASIRNYMPPSKDVDVDGSLAEALESVSRSSSPLNLPERTPKSYFDYYEKLKTEPKPSPVDKLKNVATRRPLSRNRARTPSLTHTSASSAETSPNTTPHSTRSVVMPDRSDEDSIGSAPSPSAAAAIPLPPSNVNSPALLTPREQRNVSFSSDQTESMDITEAHISPIRANDTMDQTTSAVKIREPTFSSEESSGSREERRVDDGLASAFSSPAQSAVAFTPTPAVSRPRPRFDLAAPATGEPATPLPGGSGPITPHTRRTSFLLSVINSTARPRLKAATPHPRARLATATETPGPAFSPNEEEEEDPRVGDTPAPARRALFAGITPRPRIASGPRLSHPLTRTYPASPGASELDLPGQEGANGASFISTASSHDLTTHPRANTSFDPAMGFGGAQGGVGRFNAGKLNNYLHGLNRRLQEENEALLERVRELEEGAATTENEDDVDAIASAAQRRWSGGSTGSRRISAGGTLGNVVEDVGGEGWIEEKAELEAMIDTFKDEVTKCMAEKEEAEKVLEEVQGARARDKQRWDARMAEVEQGVQSIVEDLEKRLSDAQNLAKTEFENAETLHAHLDSLKGERDLALEQAKKAQQALATGKDLGGDLRAANEQITNLMGELREASSQIKKVELEAIRSEARSDQLDEELKEERMLGRDLQQKLEQVGNQQHKLREVEDALQSARKELQSKDTYISRLESDIETTVGKATEVEEELATAQDELAQMRATEDEAYDRVEQLENEAQRLSELSKQMEDALEAAEQKMRSDEETVANLKGRVVSLEQERNRLRDAANRTRQEPSEDMAAREAEIEGLEQELDSAHQEIARLKTALSQSPARKAMEQAKEARIEMLETENEELAERIKVLRHANTEMSTPGRLGSANGMSPMHRHVLNMSVRAPKTPGGPLREMSWLASPTGGDQSTMVAPLMAEIARLQRELEQANNSIDDKLDKLGDAGLGVVGLTKRLGDARAKIIELEEEIARLSRKDDRRVRRLERLRCQKCQTKVNTRALIQKLDADESSFDISRSILPSEPPTPPTKTSNALRSELQNVNNQLSTLKKQWDGEKRELLGERAVLQENANRLNAQIASAKEESQKARSVDKQRDSVQTDLERAKSTIADLEADLKTERARLRSIGAEQARVAKEKEDVLTQMRRTESDMEDVRHQLQKYKKDNHDLESELRANTSAEHKARRLEGKVAENAETIQQLREERALLASDHKDLQLRFTQLSEQATRVHQDYANSQTVHDNRRHQLDLHSNELNELRQALSVKADALQRTEAEKDKLAAERTDVSRTVTLLEADLKRVKKDAEAFGRDLKLLRVEKDKMETKQKEELSKAERSKKQAQSQIRLLNEQLEGQKSRMQRLCDEIESHVCTGNGDQVSALKLQHNKESKGLIVQIRYLKAKFTRESSLRFALVYQKEYLIALLARREKSEVTIMSAIAKIGFPGQLPPPTVPSRKGRRLKSVANCVIFLNRLRRAADVWREESAAKAAIVAALQDVRKRRAVATS